MTFPLSMKRFRISAKTCELYQTMLHVALANSQSPRRRIIVVILNEVKNLVTEKDAALFLAG